MISNSKHKIFLICNISHSLELIDFTAFYISSELQSQKVTEYNCLLEQKPKRFSKGLLKNIVELSEKNGIAITLCSPSHSSSVFLPSSYILNYQNTGSVSTFIGSEELRRK